MLRAETQDEMNDKIVMAYIESGRINDLLSIQPAAPQTASTPLLKDYAQEWLSRKRKLKETTKVNYRKYLKEYILPVLGEKAIGDITISAVQNMLDAYKHLSFKTLKDARGVLSQIMKYAVSDELIKENP